MNKHSVWLIAPFVFLLLSAPLEAQTPAEPEAPTIEELELEEEHIRNRAEHGESHASGARPELGPVLDGNPTQAATILRVGLSYHSFNAAGTLLEFTTRHHPHAEISHT